MLGYIGAAESFRDNDPVRVHSATYEAVKREVPPAVFRDLTDPRRPYRATLASSPELFVKSLRFYRGRVLYLGGLSALHSVGLSWPSSTVWLSLLSCWATCLVVLVWLTRLVPVWAATAGAVLVAYLPPIVECARLATPDMLATLAVLAFLFFLLERPLLPAALPLAGAAIGVRNDELVLIAPLLLAVAFANGTSARARHVLLTAAASAVAFYILISRVTGSPGWWVVFQFTFVSQTADIDTLSRSFDFPVYLRVLGDAWHGFWSSPLVAPLFLTVTAVGASQRSVALRDRLSLAGLGLIGSSILRFVLFPAGERLFAPHVLGMLMVSLCAFSKLSRASATE